MYSDVRNQLRRTSDVKPALCRAASRREPGKDENDDGEEDENPVEKMLRQDSVQKKATAASPKPTRSVAEMKVPETSGKRRKSTEKTSSA